MESLKALVAAWLIIATFLGTFLALGLIIRFLAS
jgi:hypothetical protein